MWSQAEDKYSDKSGDLQPFTRTSVSKCDPQKSFMYINIDVLDGAKARRLSDDLPGLRGDTGAVWSLGLRDHRESRLDLTFPELDLSFIILAINCSGMLFTDEDKILMYVFGVVSFTFLQLNLYLHLGACH